MDGGQLHATAGHHPGGHGAVQPAADEHRRLAAGPHGDAPGAGLGVGVDKGVQLPHLHPDGQVGVVHVHLEVGELLQQVAAHLGGDLRGLVGEFLVAALALHFKGGDGVQLFRQILCGPPADGVQLLFADAGPDIAHHPKHLGHPLLGQVQVGLGIFGHHVHGGLPGGYGELPGRLQAAADIFQENVLKGPAVEAL